MVENAAVENELMPLEYNVKGNATICKHYEFISIESDGRCLIGASNLSGRYWIGEASYYADIHSTLNSSKCLSVLPYNIGMCDGKFVDNNKVIIGDDFGKISVYTIDKETAEDTYLFYPEAVTGQHDGSVLSLSVSTDKSSAVSGSIDRSIRVWNLEELCTKLTYNTAHANQVNSVAFAIDETNIFASASSDGSVLLWDTRKNFPAQTLLKSENDGFTACDWFTATKNELIVGSDSGSISLIDVRKTNQILCSAVPINRPVYRFAINDENTYVAVCSDHNEIRVFSYKSGTLSLKTADKRHKDFVRGLAWHKKHLFSVSYDGKILQHSIS